jgi:2,4-dienoyl-CoA reductase-like NADH-dependent reductase (Old Yellow Enzyme family)
MAWKVRSTHGYLLARFLWQMTAIGTNTYAGHLESDARIFTAIADNVREHPNNSSILGDVARVADPKNKILI